MEQQEGTKKVDLIWGAAAIAREINRNKRQTFYLLEKKVLPAKQINGRWCIERSDLARWFRDLPNGEAA